MASRVAIVVLVVLALAVGAFFLWPRAPVLPPAAEPAPAAPPAAPQGPRFPLASAPPEEPLPALSQSDAVVVSALDALAASRIAGLLVPEDLVRRIVATIDNLPREAYAARLNPVRPPGGLLKATGRDERLAIAPENARRYAPYVDALEAVDAQRLVGVYMRLYPLFQEAYMELGYPSGYFNDRLVEVIDHLLAAPEPAAPVKLATPHVLYEFADPDLEASSAGHKLMMRMGAANEARVKAKLRVIRGALVPAPG